MKLLLFLYSAKNLKVEYISLLNEITKRCSPKLKIPLPPPIHPDELTTLGKENYFLRYSSLFEDRKESDKFFDLALYFEEKIFTISEKARSLSTESSFAIRPESIFTSIDGDLAIDISKVLSILSGVTPIFNFTFNSLFPSAEQTSKYLKDISSRNEKRYSLHISTYVSTVTDFADVQIRYAGKKFDYDSKNLYAFIGGVDGLSVNFFSYKAREYRRFSPASLILAEEIYIKYFVENFFEELVSIFRSEGIEVDKSHPLY